jgi:hypothetical protein
MLAISLLLHSVDQEETVANVVSLDLDGFVNSATL